MRKAILAGALFILSATFNAYAEAPNLFTYQGRLKEGGQAVSGNRTVEIKLCPVETGGVCETTGAQPVAVSNGLFRSTFTIPAAVNFGTGSWWLEIKVGADTLAPRERLTSNAYSLFSATAAYAENISAATGSDGVYISSNLYVTGGKYYGDGSQLQNLPVSGGAVAKAGDAMTGQLTLYGSTLTVGGSAFSVGGAAFRVENGKIGIGTIAPSGIMEINGTDNPQLLLTDLSGDVTFAMRYSNGAPRHILGVPYYNDRVVLTNKNAPFPSQPDSSLILWDSGVTTLQMGTGGYLSFVAGTATEKARLTPQGNLGIGNTAPLYRLVVSSAAGEAGNMVVISTGASDVIRLTGAGEIYANYYHGNGSNLTGVTATAYTGTLSVANGGTGLTTIAAGNILFSSGLDTYTAAPITAFGRSLLDDADAATALTTLGAQAAVTGGATSILSSDLTANRALLSDGSGKVAVSAVTNTELGYLSGATGAIQTQLSGKLGNTSTVPSTLLDLSTVAVQLAAKAGLAGDEAIGGLKVFTSTLSVNHTVLVQGNHAVMLSTNTNFGGGLRHDQGGNETMIMAVRNASSKIYLATAYDVSNNAGGGLSLPASPELVVMGGKVGVNKAAPGYALDVTGSVNASGSLCIAGNCKSSWSSIDNLGNHIATQALDLAGNQLVGVSSATLGGPLTLSGSSVTLRSAGAAKFGVDTNGHVGINAAPHSSAGLNIYGTSIYDAGIMLDNSGNTWAIHNNAGVMTFTKGDGATASQLYLTRGGNLTVPNGTFVVGSTLSVRNQSVGINSTSPAAALDVKSTATASNIYAQVWKNSDSVIVSSMSSTGLLALSTLTATGQIGAGTMNPRSKLDVWGGSLYLGRTGVEHGSINADDSLNISIDANNDDSSNNAYFEIGHNSTGGGPVLLHIRESGAVGIGNSSPAAALDVKSTGTLVTQYAQIWRNSSGTEIASMTATGVFNIAGDIRIAAAGSGLQVAEGANARMGTVTLVAGTAIVSNNTVTANTRIFLTVQTPGGTVGSPYVSARVAGTTFTINSTQATDTSTVAWLLIEP